MTPLSWRRAERNRTPLRRTWRRRTPPAVDISTGNIWRRIDKATCARSAALRNKTSIRGRWRIGLQSGLQGGAERDSNDAKALAPPSTKAQADPSEDEISGTEILRIVGEGENPPALKSDQRMRPAVGYAEFGEAVRPAAGEKDLVLAVAKIRDPVEPVALVEDEAVAPAAALERVGAGETGDAVRPRPAAQRIGAAAARPGVIPVVAPVRPDVVSIAAPVRLDAGVGRRDARLRDAGPDRGHAPGEPVANTENGERDRRGGFRSPSASVASRTAALGVSSTVPESGAPGAKSPASSPAALMSIS